jgi:CRP-like cAMP-binding protein
MAKEMLGRTYRNGEVIIRQGAPGGCLYVVQEGQVEVVKEVSGREVRLAVRGAGEFVGEMGIFERRDCTATVRALGQARVLTIDKGTFLRQISEDPSLAFHLMQQMGARLRAADEEIIRLKHDV